MYSLTLHGRTKSIIELQKWRVSLNFISFSNPFSFSSSATCVDASPKVSRKGKTEKVINPPYDSSVRSLFTSHGFTDSQISTIIDSYPQLLIANVEESISPNLQCLKSRGASASELTKILSKVPQILGLKKGKSVGRYYDFVKEIVQADDDDDNSSKLLLLSLPEEGCKQESKIRNISALRQLGVPQKLLFPLLISKCPHVCGKERFQETVNKVIDMGFDPTMARFLYALRILYDMSDKTIQEKVNIYKRLGFTEEEVWVIFKQYPSFMGISEKNILNTVETFLGLGFSRDEIVLMVKRFPSCIGLSLDALTKKAEFLVKKMNWPLKCVVSYPVVLGLSMEKRIKPRCNVIKALMSKGLIGRDDKVPAMYSVLKYTDKVFTNKFVKIHKDIEPELMAIFTAGRGP